MSVIHTSVRPSLAGRPRAPTLTTPRPAASSRDQCSPVCVQTTTSASASPSSRRTKPEGVVLSHRNSLIFRGEPWQSSNLRPAIDSRMCPGSVPIQALCPGLVRRSV